jgi:tRNA-dihydrouridine synthase A
MVYKLVEDFPNLSFTINGGISTYDDALEHLSYGVAGVMVGRSVVNEPYYWRQIDSICYDTDDSGLSRRDILQRYADYARAVEAEHGPKVRRVLLKPTLGLFTGEHNGKKFRAAMDTIVKDQSIDIGSVFLQAADVLSDNVLDLK